MRKADSAHSLGRPPKPEECRLTIELPEDRQGLKTSTSMTSLNVRMKKNIRRIRHNQCVGVVVMLVLGATFQGLAYMASVWSAELNAELIEAAVAKHEQSFNYKVKKAVSGAPSKYLIGLLNFAGRTFSAIGTLMLVQVVVTFCRRRRGRCMRSTGGQADDMLAEQLQADGGFSEAIGECCMGCMSFA
ncbi:hypothetical protein M3Y99_01698100 [Aphelenchoides fujianensis]|nr:hypothetical protein M3Y99_01698100 [Aphelenchoides fujianensis]